MFARALKEDVMKNNTPDISIFKTAFYITFFVFIFYFLIGFSAVVESRDNQFYAGHKYQATEKNPKEKKESKEKQKKRVKKEYPRKDERYNMVKTQIEKRGVKDKKVLDAMRYVPRHSFVPEIGLSQAYDDNPLPIGYGQTISQPYIVGLMTESLKLDENSRVLEIGTGSGYQAAVLAEIAKDVYTIEIIKALYTKSTYTLETLEYFNVETKHADGYYGWQEKAPFDAIIVTAASDHVPPPLIKQLKVGGLMCIPLGAPNQVQRLVLVTKDENGKVKTQDIIPVRFVPLTRQLQ